MKRVATKENIGVQSRRRKPLDTEPNAKKTTAPQVVPMDMTDAPDDHKENCNEIFSFKAMHSLRSVRELDLSSSRIQKIPFMLDLPLLEELHLDHNMLTTTSGLLLCTALRYINFADNKIRAVNMLEMQVNLEVLNLSNNVVGLPEKSVRTLALNPKLSTIRVKGNPCAKVPRYWVLFANIIGEQLVWVDSHRVHKARSASCGRMRYGQQRAHPVSGKYAAKGVSCEKPASVQFSSRPQRKSVPQATTRMHVEQPKKRQSVRDVDAEVMDRKSEEPQECMKQETTLTDTSSRQCIAPDQLVRSPVASEVSIVINGVSDVAKSDSASTRRLGEEPAPAFSELKATNTHVCAETQTSPQEERSARCFCLTEPAHLHHAGIAGSAFAFAPSLRDVATSSLEHPPPSEGSPQRHATSLTASVLSMSPEEPKVKARGSSTFDATCPEPDMPSVVHAALADAVNPQNTVGKSKSWHGKHFGWKQSFTPAKKKKPKRSATYCAASLQSGLSMGSSSSMFVSTATDYVTSPHASDNSENSTAVRAASENVHAQAARSMEGNEDNVDACKKHNYAVVKEKHLTHAHGSSSPSRLPEGRSSSPTRFFVHRPDTPQCRSFLRTYDTVDESQPDIEEVRLSSRAPSHSLSVNEVERLPQSASPNQQMAVPPSASLIPASQDSSPSYACGNYLNHDLDAEKEDLPSLASPCSMGPAENLEMECSSTSPYREMTVSSLASSVSPPLVHVRDRMRSSREEVSFSNLETPLSRGKTTNDTSSHAEEVNPLWRATKSSSELANMETLMLPTSSSSAQEQREQNTSPTRHFGNVQELSGRPQRNTSPDGFSDPLSSSCGTSSMRAHASRSTSPLPNASHAYTSPFPSHDRSHISSIGASHRASSLRRAECSTNPAHHDAPSAVQSSTNVLIDPQSSTTSLQFPHRAHGSASSPRSGDRGLCTENALLARLYRYHESPSSHCSNAGASYCSPTDTSPMLSVRDSYHCPSSDVSPIRAHERLYPLSQNDGYTYGNRIVQAPTSNVRWPDASATNSPPSNIEGERVPLSRSSTVDDASPTTTTITLTSRNAPMATQDAHTLGPLPSYEEIAELLGSFRSALAPSPPSVASSTPCLHVPPRPQGTYPPRHRFGTSSPLCAAHTPVGLDQISRSTSPCTGSDQSPSWHVTRVSPPSHKSTIILHSSSHPGSNSMLSGQVVATEPTQWDFSVEAQSDDWLTPHASPGSPAIECARAPPPYFPIPDDLFPLSTDDALVRGAGSEGVTCARACPYASLIGASPRSRERYVTTPTVMVSPRVKAQYGYFHGGEVDMFGGALLFYKE